MKVNIVQYTLVLLGCLVGGTINAQRNETSSLNKLWKSYENAEKKNLPNSQSNTLDSIISVARKTKQSADYLEASLLKTNITSYRMGNINEELFGTIAQLEKEPWLSSRDYAFIAYIKLMILANKAERLNYNGANETFIEHATLPEKLAEWSLPDLVQSANQSLTILKGRLSSLIGVSPEYYKHIAKKGNASEYMQYDLAYAIILSLAPYFSIPQGSLYTASYRVHPSNTPLSSEQLLLNNSEFEKFVQKTQQKEHLPLYYYWLVATAEQRSNTLESKILYRQLRASSGTFLNPEVFLNFLNKLIQNEVTLGSSNEVILNLIADKATLLIELNRPNEALLLCQKYSKGKTNSPSIAKLKTLIESIKTPIVSLEMKSTRLMPNKPLVFKLQRKVAKTVTLQFYDISEAYKNAMLKSEPTQEIKDLKYKFEKGGATAIKSKLVNTHTYTYNGLNPYQITNETITVAGLPLGVYFVSATAEGVVFDTEIIYITSLFPLLLSDASNNYLLLLDAVRGNAIANGSLRLYNYQRAYSNNNETLKTNSVGIIPLRWQGNHSSQGIVYSSLLNDYYASPLWLFTNDNNITHLQTQQQTILFTDRAIYRPNQTMHFKGIAFEATPNNGVTMGKPLYNVKLRQGQKVILLLRNNVTGEQVNIGEYTTSTMGSFHGDYLIPRNLLSGNYTLDVKWSNEQQGYGYCTVHIEEYKRPTYELIYEEHNNEYLYGQAITVPLHAKYFSGSPVSKAKVLYQLQATVYEYHDFNFSSKQFDISKGNTLSDNNGNIAIEGLKLALNSNQEKQVYEEFHKQGNELYVTYTLKVKATNQEGETYETTIHFRTGHQQAVLTLSLHEPILIKERMNKLELNLSTFNTENIKGIKGELSLYKNNRNRTQVLSKPFTTGQPLALPITQLASGKYILEAEVKAEGYQAKLSTNIVILSLEDKTLPIDTTLFVHPLEQYYSHQSPIRIVVATSSKQDIYLQTDEHNISQLTRNGSIQTANGEKLAVTKVTPTVIRFTLNNTIKQLILPLSKTYNQIQINLFTVSNGKLYSKQLSFDWNEQPKAPTPKIVVEGLSSVYRPGDVVTLNIALQDSLGKFYESEAALWVFDSSLNKLARYHKPQLNTWQQMPQQPYFGYHNLFPSNYLSLWGSPRNNNELPYLSLVFTVPTKFLYSYNYGQFMPWRYWSATNGEQTIGSDLQVSGYNYAMDSYNRKQVMLTSSIGNEKALALDAEGNNAKSIGYVSDVKGKNGITEGTFEDIKLRTDFNETAVWKPTIKLNSDGFTQVSFTLPESLTQYELHIFAHNNAVKSFPFHTQIKVNKPLSIMPNLPRYIRHGDHATIATTVTNCSNNIFTGSIKLLLINPQNNKVVCTQNSSISIESQQSKLHTFKLPTLNMVGLLKCIIQVSNGKLSDALEKLIPILPIQQPVIESVPITIYNNRSQNVFLDTLFNHSDSLSTNRSITLSLNANPLWGALTELPYAINSSNNDAVSLVMALQANEIAKNMVTAEPELKTLLEHYKAEKENGTERDSRLTNEPTKRILATELGAFYGIAIDEKNGMDNLLLLLNEAYLKQKEQERISALRELQNRDGGFSWLPGMPSNLRNTILVIEGIANIPEGDLKKQLKPLAIPAANYVYNQFLRQYEQQPQHTKYYWFSADLITIVNHFLPQKFTTPDKIVRSVLDSYTSNIPNLGIFELSTFLTECQKAVEKKYITVAKERLVQYLYPERNLGLRIASGHAPGSYWISSEIVEQAIAVKALSNFPEFEKQIESMRMYLLNLYRTNQWNNALATSYAMNALFGKKSKLMEYNNGASITLNTGQSIDVSTNRVNNSTTLPIANKTFRLTDSEKIPSKATVIKQGKGVAWGSVTASFVAPITNIEAMGNDDLSIKRMLFVERKNSDGEWRKLPIASVNESLKIGDKLTVELTISSGRSYDFVLIRDKKPGAVEVVDPISGYKRMSNSYFSYYYEPKDSEVRFYLEHLGKGTHTITYQVIVDRIGKYAAGIAEIQAVYSPEFVAHSSGKELLNIEE